MKEIKLPVKDLGETFELKAPRTKKHLALYLSIVFNCRLPYPASMDDFCVKNDHKSPLDAMWAAYAELDYYSIWYAMRGTGKTYDLSLLSFIESVFKPHCGINVLGGSLEQSTRAVSYLKTMWETWKSFKNVDIADINIKPTQSYEYKDIVCTSEVSNNLLGKNKDIAGRGYKLSNGSWVNALAASTKSVRGPHPQKLRLDEVDEMDEKIYNAAMGQPKKSWGIKDNVIISSTLHNAFGLMSRIIDNRFDLGANLYPWCVNEVIYPSGFWEKEEIERKKKQIPKAMWEAEYLLKRPKIGDSIFDFESVDRSYARGRNDKYDKLLPCEGGVDWGYNVTVLNLIQDTREKYKNIESHPFELIELTQRCREIADICIDRKISVIYADSNPKDSNITLKTILESKRTGTKLVPVAFSKWKDIAINVLRFLLENNLLNISDKICQDKMKKYHYKNVELGIIAKEDDHYPDSLIAWAASRYKLLADIDTQIERLKNNKLKGYM
ncbi:MAG: hypothetical protein WC346_17980 [Methanogenium sp.]|jgi:hypothetical protein